MTNSLTSSLPDHFTDENNILEIAASHEFLTTIPTCFHYVHFIGFLYFLLNISISAYKLLNYPRSDGYSFAATNPDCLLISNNLTMSHFYNFICL